LRSSAAARIRHGVGDRLVAIGIAGATATGRSLVEKCDRAAGRASVIARVAKRSSAVGDRRDRVVARLSEYAGRGLTGFRAG
jgi:hypothetical protein